MKRELPENLHSTCDLLAGSLQMRSSDQASQMPGELFDDLALRFNRVPAKAASAPSVSWFEKLQSFIARPAFGVAAFAMIILALTLPSMMSPTQGSGFRGANPISPTSEAVHIVLIHAPSEILRDLENSGDFEKGAISAVERVDDTLQGARVMVNFETSEITVVNGNGETTFTTSLPEDPNGLSSAIASAVSRL